MTVKHKTFQAIRWTTLSVLFRAVLQLAQIGILARLLAPADFGLMAMVGVVLSFVALFADMGFNNAYVQRQEISNAERSSLYWMNVLFGAVLTVALLACSPLIAGVFGDARLKPLLMLVSSTIVINAIGQQLRKHAEKQLHFGSVMIVEILAAISGFAASVTTAIFNWGVYALAAGALTTALTSSVLAWSCLADGWRPMLRIKWPDIRSFLGFGSAAVASDLINEVNRGVDLLLGGRMLTATALGLYSVPRQVVFQLQGMINPIITRVGFPLIAQVQHDRCQVRSIYLKTLNMTASINAPLYLGLAAFASPLIALVFGDKWKGSVDLMSLLALWGFVRSTANPAGSLLLGMGRADMALKWNFAQMLILPGLLWCGSHWGVMGLAWALLAHSAIMFVPAWLLLVRPLCVATLWDYTVATMRPLFLAVVAIGTARLMDDCVKDSCFQLPIAILVATPIYLSLSYFFNRDWINAMRHLVFDR